MNMKLFRVHFGSFNEFDATDKDINKTLILTATLCEKKERCSFKFYLFVRVARIFSVMSVSL